MQIRVLIIIFIILFTPSKILGNTIEIVLKIDDKIITNIDVSEEIKYLSLLNPKLKNINRKSLYNIAKSSLTREIIKKKELKKILDIDANFNLSNSIEKKLINILAVENLNDLKTKIAKNNLKYEKVFFKLKIESLWNMYIFEKFNKKVKIDEEYLMNQVKKQKQNIKPKYEYYNIRKTL